MAGYTVYVKFVRGFIQGQQISLDAKPIHLREISL